MCGIAGYVTVEPASLQTSILERMTDAIRHRGPDDSGYYQDEYASLGHRRLSIIDVAARPPAHGQRRPHAVDFV